MFAESSEAEQKADDSSGDSLIVGEAVIIKAENGAACHLGRFVQQSEKTTILLMSCPEPLTLKVRLRRCSQCSNVRPQTYSRRIAAETVLVRDEYTPSLPLSDPLDYSVMGASSRHL